MCPAWPGLAKLRESSRLRIVTRRSGRGCLDSADAVRLAKRHGLEPDVLAAWLDYLALRPAHGSQITGLFTKKWNVLVARITSTAGDCLRLRALWRIHRTPNTHPRPGAGARCRVILRPRCSWPWVGKARSTARSLSRPTADAHPECGNGGEWWVQHHNKVGNLRVYGTGGGGEFKPVTLQVYRGDVVRLVVGPKDGSHACDLTHADMTLTETGGAKGVGYFEGHFRQHPRGQPVEGSARQRCGLDYSGKVADVAKMSGNAMSVPEGSLPRSGATSRTPYGARRWPVVSVACHRQNQAPPGTPDATCYAVSKDRDSRPVRQPAEIDPAGRAVCRHPLGHTVVSADLIMKAPEVVELRIPAALAGAGRSSSRATSSRNTAAPAACN